ncbi:MAG: hypothetical protein PF501_11270 [Salinisphaera sp.]|nr:hypothetical protein [Salinisphaera sp.]
MKATEYILQCLLGTGTGSIDGKLYDMTNSITLNQPRRREIPATQVAPARERERS